MTSWEASAARRLLQVFERRDTRTNQLILRLQLPLRTAEIVSPGLDETRFPGHWASTWPRTWPTCSASCSCPLRAARPAVARMPRTRRSPSTGPCRTPRSGPDASGPVRQAERYAERRGDPPGREEHEWFVRVAHKIIAGEAEPRPTPPMIRMRTGHGREPSANRLPRG